MSTLFEKKSLENFLPGDSWFLDGLFSEFLRPRLPVPVRNRRLGRMCPRLGGYFLSLSFLALAEPEDRKSVV